MEPLSIQTALGSLRLVAEGQVYNGTGVLGLTDDDIRLTCGANPWIGIDRIQVVRTLDTFLYGMLDVLALPRISVPAEYVAATIAVTVDALNIMVACRWMEKVDAGAAYDLAEGTEAQPATARQLFALCTATLSSPTNRSGSKRMAKTHGDRNPKHSEASEQCEGVNESRKAKTEARKYITLAVADCEFTYQSYPGNLDRYNPGWVLQGYIHKSNPRQATFHLFSDDGA